MSVKIAIAGKGGSGKTTLAALLCRTLIDRGMKPLLAVDADPNSCLPERLGLPVHQTIGEMREELRADPESVPKGVPKSEWIEQLIHEDISEAQGLDLLVMGRQEGPGCYCYINSILRDCLDKIGKHYQGVVIDNEAGLEHLSRRTSGKVELMLVVCPPTMIGARTAGRIVKLISELELDFDNLFLILNPCDGELNSQLAHVFAETGAEILGRIPPDAAVKSFDETGQSLFELPLDSPAAKAVGELVTTLSERRLL